MGHIDQATATLTINVAMYIYLGVLIGMVWGMKLILDRKLQVMEWAKEEDEEGSWTNTAFDLEIVDDVSPWDEEISTYEETEEEARSIACSCTRKHGMLMSIEAWTLYNSDDLGEITDGSIDEDILVEEAQERILLIRELCDAAGISRTSTAGKALARLDLEVLQKLVEAELIAA